MKATFESSVIHEASGDNVDPGDATDADDADDNDVHTDVDDVGDDADEDEDVDKDVSNRSDPRARGLHSGGAAIRGLALKSWQW